MQIRGLQLSLGDAKARLFASMCGDIARSGKFVLGPLTSQVEDTVGHEFGGVTLAYSSCTDAQQAYLTAVQAEVVIMVGYSFPSTMVAAVRSGAEVVTVDCDPYQMTFSLKQIEGALKNAHQHRVAVLIAHLGGYVFEGMSKLKSLCHQYGVSLLEDISHSWGAFDSQHEEAGSWGDVVFASLFATKPLHAATGGVVTLTSQGKDSGVYQMLVSMREYGCESPTKKSVLIHSGGSWRMSEMEAALFLVNYADYRDEVARRVWIIDQYRKANPDKVFAPPSGGRPNGYRAYLKVPNVGAAEAFFHDHGVGLVGRVYESPGDQSPVLQGYAVRLSRQVPQEELSWSNGHVCLPCYGSMTEDDVAYVCKVLGLL